MSYSSMYIANKNILKHLNSNSITIRQLALDIDMDPSHLRKILNGKLPLSLHYIDRICERLAIPVYEIFIDSSIKFIPQPESVNIQITANSYCLIRKIEHILNNILQ